MRNRFRAGIVLPAVIACAAAVLILSLALYHLSSSNARQNAYLRSMDHAFRLAESGLHDALGQLAMDPNLSDGTAYALPTTLPAIKMPEEKGEYQNTIQRSTYPVDSAFYVVTSATRSVGGQVFSSRLHTYARITNLSLYFAATNDDLAISAGANLGSGRVYAPRLTFLTSPGSVTRLGRAEFVDRCDPDLDWSDPTKDAIDITDPTADQPVKLDRPLVFPDINDFDLERYKKWAGPHTTTGDFTLHPDIFPPGYEGAKPNEDKYPGHLSNNEHHVYYFDGPMSIKGTVHGQVLFVASGDITITGDLVSSTSGDLPGANFASSSTAHQAILITKGKVVIHQDAYCSSFGSTLDIQALIIAPNGTLIPGATCEDTDTSTIENEFHESLGFNFSGSLILRTLNNHPPQNLVTVFQGSRTYGYMNSLATAPPPYLPAMAEIFYSLEETTSTGEMY